MQHPGGDGRHLAVRARRPCGDTLLAAGQALTPAALGLAAAASHATLSARIRPRIAIFASGDELREAGEVLAPGEVVNSAGHAVAALVALWGGGAHRQPTLPDDPRRDPRRDRGCARRHPAVHRRRIGRETSLPMLPAMFATAILEGGSRETWWRASAAIDGTGRLVVTPDPRRDSSLQRPLAEANALIRRPSGALASGAGELVDITLIAAIRLRSA